MTDSEFSAVQGEVVQPLFTQEGVAAIRFASKESYQLECLDDEERAMMLRLDSIADRMEQWLDHQHQYDAVAMIKHHLQGRRLIPDLSFGSDLDPGEG